MQTTTYDLKKAQGSDTMIEFINTIINGNVDKIATELVKRLVTSGIVAGTNITVVPNTTDNTVTISASDGTQGQDGREVQLQTTSTHIQWKYSTDTLWTDLIALSSLKGAKGDIGANGQDGFSPIATVNKSGATTTISVTDKNGITTATVLDGVDGVNGTNGADGFSPTASVTKVGSVATITITDKTGTTTATVLDGTGGSGEGGTTDYNYLSNKPSVNNVELSGNKTSSDLGLADKSHTHNISDVTVNGDILPSTTNINIGSATKRFKALYVDEAHLSTNTLYIGDTPLIGTTGATVNIQADDNQTIDVNTKGTGNTKISSTKQVDVIASGTNALVNVQSANQLNIQAPTINIQGTTNMIQGDTTFTGNVNIQGTTTSVNATNLEIKDNIIELNKGEVGSGISKGSAGIKVDRGDLDAQFLVFDEVDDRFKVGTATAKETLAYKSEIPTVTNDLTNTLKANYDSAYTHSTSAHAPVDAQKNSDITKEEIEAKLIGEIATHTHSTTEIDNKIGVLTGLTTTAKTDLVSAVNENKASISSNAQQINVLLRTENIVPTYINNFANLWGYTKLHRKGYGVDITVACDFSNVTDKTLPLFYMKYKPSFHVYFDMSMVDGSYIKMYINPSDGGVYVFTWYQTKVLTSGMGYTHYVTEEEFR